MSKRDWQIRAENTIEQVLNSDKNEIVPVNACVGSGKTNVAWEAMLQFIRRHEGAETLHTFVCPRLNLCAQQAQDCEKYFKENGITGVSVVLYNSDGKGEHLKDTSNAVKGVQHVVVVSCEKTLWGDSDESDHAEETRVKKFANFLNVNSSAGRLLGVIAYDEAHNYSGRQKTMFGAEFDKYGLVADNFDDINLKDFFKLNLVLSGTPHDYEKGLVKVYPNNVCNCSVAEAVDKKYICKPTLNLITNFFGGSETDRALPVAIKKILEREQEINDTENKGFLPKILVCCSNIVSIHNIVDVLDEKGLKAGKDYHSVILHTEKKVQEDGIEKEAYVPELDGVCVDKDAVTADLTKIDSNEYNVPVIAFQVDMLSEGVNISSFNAVFIQSKSGTKQMQQIGRVLRNWKVNGYEKKLDSHASVYAFCDDSEKLGELLHNLSEADLTDDVFMWGSKIDLTSGGTKKSESEDEIPEEASWKEIDVNVDIKEFYKQFDCLAAHQKVLMEGLPTESVVGLETLLHLFNSFKSDTVSEDALEFQEEFEATKAKAEEAKKERDDEAKKPREARSQKEARINADIVGSAADDSSCNVNTQANEIKDVEKENRITVTDIFKFLDTILTDEAAKSIWQEYPEYLIAAVFPQAIEQALTLVTTIKKIFKSF